jgi:hypothetical protein
LCWRSFKWSANTNGSVMAGWLPASTKGHFYWLKVAGGCRARQQKPILLPGQIVSGLVNEDASGSSTYMASSARWTSSRRCAYRIEEQQKVISFVEETHLMLAVLVKSCILFVWLMSHQPTEHADGFTNSGLFLPHITLGPEIQLSPMHMEVIFLALL